MYKFTRYSAEIALDTNRKVTSHVNLVSDEKVSEEEFQKIVVNAFNENRDKVVCYTEYEL